MAGRAIITPIDPRDDPEQYPIHEEDDVPETVVHEGVARYVRDVLSLHVPDGWVSGDVCCYWIPGDHATYLAPDVFLVDGERPEPPPRVYLRWVHGQMRLAVEVGSRSALRRDEGPRLERYAEGLRPAEYLYFDPGSGRVQLHRLGRTGYVAVAPDLRGRVWSQEAAAWFGPEGTDMLRAYDRDGTPIRSYREEAAHAEAEAGRRAEAERRTAADAERRAEAERRAAAEAERRAEAERLRNAAERRVAELEAELARLRGAGPRA
jgi:Putative restriction endonuclease